jgi:hypothetical protein
MRRRFRALLALAALLALGACAGVDVSYDYSDIDARNIFRGETD